MKYNDLLIYLAKDQISTACTFEKIASDTNHEMNKLSQEFINDFNIIFDDMMSWSNILYEKIAELRKNELINNLLPYKHNSINDLKIDKNNLVSLSAFDLKDTAFLRNGYVFTIAPTTSSPNSSHWLTETIVKYGISNNTRVRLDPFFVYPLNEYRQAFYRMLCYGQELNWKRIESLKQDEHCRWMPNSQYSEIEFTDLVWSPRDNEIHLTCEEFPKFKALNYRGSRYFHAIYSIKNQEFIHVDGALRFYSEGEHVERINSHIRKMGKIGKRIKIFQIDSNISRKLLCDLAATFFVWNDDIQKYFRDK